MTDVFTILRRTAQRLTHPPSGRRSDRPSGCGGTLGTPSFLLDEAPPGGRPGGQRGRQRRRAGRSARRGTPRRRGAPLPVRVRAASLVARRTDVGRQRGAPAWRGPRAPTSVRPATRPCGSGHLGTVGPDGGGPTSLLLETGRELASARPEPLPGRVVGSLKTRHLRRGGGPGLEVGPEGVAER